MTPRHDAAALPFPGLRWGEYPELPEPVGGSGVRRRAGSSASRHDAARRLAHVRSQGAAWQRLSDREFLNHRGELQLALATHGLGAEQAELCCAFVVEAARRTLGMTAFDGQVLAALHMLDNRLVEMATGEGKSLAVAL